MPKLLDGMRDRIGALHESIRTERAYLLGGKSVTRFDGKMHEVGKAME